MGKKVLIIEDNEDLQEIYKIFFESEGFVVESSFDGVDGIGQLLDSPPDIIILDIMMPNMDGFQVLKAIKNEPDIQVPVIVCSNLNGEEEEKKALYYGADLFLRKSDYEGEEIVEKAINLIK